MRVKSMTTKAVTLVLCGLFLVAGCSATTTVVRRESRVARFQVTSQPAGATVYVDAVPQGRSPAEVELPYAVVEKEIQPAEHKNGWVLLVTGLVATIGGIAATAWAASNLGDTDEGAGTMAGRIMALSFGPTGALYGLYGIIGGIYYLAAHPSSMKVTEITPRQISLGINIPGQGLRRAQLASLGPAGAVPEFGKVRRIHYSAATGLWAAPGLPDSLELRDASGRAAAVATAPVPSGHAPPPALPAPPQAEDSPERPDVPAATHKMVQDLRRQGEACYRRRDYSCALQRFERAFALAPSPAMRFNLASALDKLGREASAVRQYQRYLSEAGDTASPSALAHIQRRMKVLLAGVARLHLTIDPAAATVTVDGVPLATLTSQFVQGRHEAVLDPGAHRLDISHTGYRSRTVEAALVAGELKSLDVTLERAR
jgi:hypothetical protein